MISGTVLLPTVFPHSQPPPRLPVSPGGGATPPENPGRLLIGRDGRPIASVARAVGDLHSAPSNSQGRARSMEVEEPGSESSSDSAASRAIHEPRGSKEPEPGPPESDGAECGSPHSPLQPAADLCSKARPHLTRERWRLLSFGPVVHWFGHTSSTLVLALAVISPAFVAPASSHRTSGSRHGLAPRLPRAPRPARLQLR